MPGIVGIVSKGSPERNRRDLERMVGSLMHEPSYRKGTYIDEDLGLYIGSVSHPGAFDDGMPLVNEAKDVLIMLSGEIFQPPALKQTLAARGHAFDPATASYLVHGYEEEGDSFFRSLNGWYCGILIDRRRSRAVIFNDRYGMRRLYYSEGDGSVRFSTEAKALLLLDGVERSFHDGGLAEYFVFGCPLQQRTLFKGLFQVPGASQWIIQDKGIVQKGSYFGAREWEERDPLPLETFYARLRETFREILPQYAHPRPTIGLSLTGGLDTRMIVANLSLEPHRLPCYTFSGLYRDCADARTAQRIAAVCGQDHTIIRLDRAFLKEFSKYAEKAVRISEGTIDLSAAADLYLNSRAKELTAVRLTGNYGSEVLRRIRWLRGRSRPPAVMHPDLGVGLDRSGEFVEDLYAKHPLTFTLFYDGPWHEYGRFAVESSQLVQRTPYMDDRLVELVYQAPPEATVGRAVSIRLIADGDPRLSHIPTDRGVPLDGPTVWKSYSQFVSQVFFKADYHLGYGAPHWLARIRRGVPFLPLEKMFLGRHKFNHFQPWFRNELAGFVQDVLLDPRTLSRPHFNAPFIRGMVREHLSGRANFTHEIDKAITLELTSRILLDRR